MDLKAACREMHFDGIHCKLSVQEFPGAVILLTISGTDVGEFGDAPMLELKDYLTGSQPIHLFIDARDVRGASIDVSGEWARWLTLNKAQLRTVNMLTGSKLIEVTAGFVRNFAALQGIMKIYTEPTVFDSALAAFQS
jgi:hypothetical protein